MSEFNLTTDFSPAAFLVIATFLFAIFLSINSNSSESSYLSGVTLPETIPSPKPQTDSIIILSVLFEGSLENITPDLSESIIF